MTLITEMQQIVGKKNTVTNQAEVIDFCKGQNYGSGEASFVIKPRTLLELWQALNKAIQYDCIVIMQATNTGLTGGSTPFGNDYDREVIIISTQNIKGVRAINNGKQVVCLAGATLYELENHLKPFEREPHSLLGSSCIGASVVGGICNNSGGTLTRRGPAYTELALFAQINDQGELTLVNHLGIDLGKTPEEILTRLEANNYDESDIHYPDDKKASDTTYKDIVRAVDEDTPARYNNNPKLLYEASGSAGKVCIFAVRLDTFTTEESEVFYIGTNTPQDLTEIRRFVLSFLPSLPISGEYLHHTAFTMGEKYGRDVFWFIRTFGVERILRAFAIKTKVDRFFRRFGIKNMSDKCLQALTNLFPKHLPKFMYEYQQRFEHHLMIRVAKDSVKETATFLQTYFTDHSSGTYHHCTEKEGDLVFLHRFAAAGGPVRFKNINNKITTDLVQIDVALRRNDHDWAETLIIPKELEDKVIHHTHLAHFLCHVFHQSYIVKKGTDPLAFEYAMWKELDKRRAEYPAEHNVGHLYFAKPALAKFYKKLDPTNAFNVGIGQTSRKKYWQ